MNKTKYFYVPPGDAAGHIVFGLSVRPSARPSVPPPLVRDKSPANGPSFFKFSLQMHFGKVLDMFEDG